MARKTIRIELPIGKPDAMVKLAKDIKKQHDQRTADGSPDELKDVEVQEMGARAVVAEEKRGQAVLLDAQAAKLRQEAETLIGTAPGQAATTKGTLLYDITGFRDDLLSEFRDEEAALGEYGYSVVIGTAAAPQRKAKA